MKLREMFLGFLAMPALSKREVFMLVAMKELIANETMTNPQLLARVSREFADASLAELDKDEETLKQEEATRREALRQRSREFQYITE